MLHPGKYVNVVMSLDAAYGVLGIICASLADGAVPSGCKATDEDLPELLRQFHALRSNLVKQIDAHGYREHIRDIAELLRQKEEKVK